MSQYVPRYSQQHIVRALLAVNVPYLLPILDFEGQFFKVLNGTVLFAPNEWRGTSGSADPLLHPFLLSDAVLAAKVGSYPRGTATAIYVTSDGGANIQDIFDLAAALPEHVQLVEASALVQAALATSAAAE
jgi:hypothetical protein